MLQSIARQMCYSVSGYQDSLEKKLQTDLGKTITEMNCEELLTILLEEPLCNLERTDANFVVVIDALDECSYDLKNELLTALRKKQSRLPSWLRFIITTRPSTNTSLLGLRPNAVVEINTDDPFNLQDLKIFFCFELKALYPQYCNEELVPQLAEMTKGLFLVAFFVVDVLKKENIASPGEVLKLFPNGISSVYENYFSRLKEVLLPYISKDLEGFYKMLDVIAATKNPLPKNMFYNILGLKSECDVPRAKKLARKDAVNSLHSLFPVENDHVTVFHKSVVDWLILEGDEEHEYSVRGEDRNEELDVLPDTQSKKRILDEPLYPNGREKYAKKEHSLNVGVEDDSEVLDGLPDTRSEKRHVDKPLDPTDSEKHADKAHEFSVRLVHADEVLANECHDVLSDILNGKKDLNKPFTPTDSEKYALRLGWDVFEGRSKTNDNKKYGKLRNYFTLTATICFLKYEKASSYACILYKSGLSENLSSVISNGITFFSQRYHDSWCPFRQPANFGRCVEFVLNAANMMKVSEEEIGPNPLDLLRKYKLSYFERKSIAVNFKHDLSELSVTHILPCENGFILSHYSKGYTDVQKCQLDGTCLTKKSYPGVRRMCMSPDHRFIVATKEMEKGDIEIIDATTLELVTSYPSPNVIRSCHVFGDQPWYIVARCYNNKIYVMEGETGRLGSTPTSVDQHFDVDAVSAAGHILLSTTWGSKEFTDENGNFLEKMNWRGNYQYLLPERARFRLDEILYRKLLLRHSTRIEENVPIYPLKRECCKCTYQMGFDIDNGSAVGFSNDGSLLAYLYKGSIFIIQTSNGSLYKHVFHGPPFDTNLKDYVLFLSDTYVVIHNLSIIMLINIQTNEIPHRFLISNSPVESVSFVPRKQGEPFTLLITCNRGERCLLKYEFYNIDL
jgi:hypothetical protein